MLNGKKLPFIRPTSSINADLRHASVTMTKLFYLFNQSQTSVIRPAEISWLIKGFSD
jgi:hypothetical protein